MSQPDQSGQASSSTSVQFYPLHVNLPLPEKLEISSGTLVNNWRKFKRAWENYEVAAQLKDLKNPESNKERRAATLLTSLGSDALDILDGLAFDDETQRKNPDAILARLEQYCIGEVNESFERYNFNKRDQEPHESIDAYVSSLRRLATVPLRNKRPSHTQLIRVYTHTHTRILVYAYAYTRIRIRTYAVLCYSLQKFSLFSIVEKNKRNSSARKT